MAKLLNGFADLRHYSRFAILIVLGLIAGLGQAPNDLWPVTIVALSGLLVIHGAVVSAKQAAIYVWLFGLGYFGFGLRWIVEPFLVDVARHGWMAPFALVLMAGGPAVFWALAGYLAARIAPGRLLIFGVCIVWAEVARSLILTGFPWALVGHIWVTTPLAQLAAFGGPHVLSLVTVLAAWALASLLGRYRVGGAGVLAAVVVVGLAIRPGPAPSPTEDQPMIRLVQPNAPQRQKWDLAYRDIFFRRLVDFSNEGDVPDLIVWPETAIPSLLNYVAPDMSVLVEAARGAPLVFGIQRRDELNRFYNSFVVMDGQGDIAGVYDKSHLVPFGEYIPGGSVVARLGLTGLAAVATGGFTPGTGIAPIDIPGIGPAVPLICYEGIFAEEIPRDRDRPRLMILITNDAWFGQAVGPYQHLAQARLRAIEQGLPMVRVANTGVSAMIDAKGRIVAAIPLGVDDAIDVALPVALRPTIYARWGDAPSLVLLTLLTLGLYSVRHRDSD